MTPPARIQAAIELLDQIIAAAREGGAAADTLIARYFATRRYAGSSDRRAVRELVYEAVRRCGERPASGRAAMLALATCHPDIHNAFDGSPHGPAPIGPDEAPAIAGAAPAWLAGQLAESGIPETERPSLLGRAPLDVRVNTLLTSRDEVGGGELGGLIEGLPDALRLPGGSNLAPLAGLVEVQDAGSQTVTLAARARPGQHIIDLCAGGGGKTLALAAAMANQGQILACDTDRGRLQRLPPRAEKAGVTIVETRLLDPGREEAALIDWRDRADCVLVDAPCSGTGTWRRNPEARWRLTPDRLDRLAETQAYLLRLAAPLVRPGGALVYVVCSLLDQEGRGQIEAFLAEQPDWAIDELALPFGRPHGAGVRLTPAHDGTDGFFVARLIRPC